MTSLWLGNLLDYFIQVALLATIGGVMPLLLRVRDPGVRLLYRQSLLGVCLLLPFLQPWRAAVPTTSPGFAIEISSAAGHAQLAGYSWATIAMVGLAAGVIARWLWLALGMARLRGLRSHSQPINGATAITGRTALQGCKVGRKVGIYVSPQVEGPVTFGWLRPVILLPESFLRSTPEVQTAVLTHELIHIERRDWLWTVGEELVRGLLWFHPAMHWLIGEIQLAREQVVDRQVVERIGSREAYLRALVEITKARRGPSLAAAPAFLRRRHFKARIKILLEDISMTKLRLVSSVVGMTAVLVAATILSVSSFPLHAAPQESDKVHRVGNGTSAPRLLTKVEPTYTDEARDAGLEGTVILKCEVWPDGKAHNIAVFRGLGRGLDEQARKTVEQWEFEPGMRDGEAVKVRATVEMNFRL